MARWASCWARLAMLPTSTSIRWAVRILVPGVGAQGADASDVARLFSGCDDPKVLVSVSRDILNAGPERRSLRDAAQRWRDSLWSALG